MSRGKKKRMLVHTQDSLGWKTEEFYSATEAIKELRRRGLKFSDDRTFFQPEFYGIIVGDNCFVEVEEVADYDESLPINGTIYIPLAQWAKENGFLYDTVKHASAKGNLPTIKIGRIGKLYIESNYKWNKKGTNINKDGKTFIPLKKWAKREKISDTTARNAFVQGLLIGHIVTSSDRKYYYIEEGEKWIEVR